MVFPLVLVRKRVAGKSPDLFEVMNIVNKMADRFQPYTEPRKFLSSGIVDIPSKWL